jgi:hypothetical protein
MCAGPRPAHPVAPLPAPITAERWLVVRSAGDANDWAVLSRFLVDNEPPPSELAEPNETGRHLAHWEVARELQPANAVCAYTRIVSDHDEVRMARLSGAKYLFVNGEGFVGESKAHESRGVPIALRRGDNHIFVAGVFGPISLTCWCARTRVVVGTWDVRWPYGNVLGDLDFPVFNASLSTVAFLHVHYGHAVDASGKCKPHLSDWRDGGHIVPLGMMMGESYYTGFDECDLDSISNSATVPICVYAADDQDADRQLLQPPRLAEGAQESNLNLVDRSLSKVAGSLIQRLGSGTVMVYGTHGSAEECRALLARARFDQQLVWYEAGVVPLLISDDVYVASANAPNDNSYVPYTVRSKPILLYGNADTNSAWP